MQKNKPSDRSMEVSLPALLENDDRPTDRPTDHQADIRGRGEVTLPINGMGNFLSKEIIMAQNFSRLRGISLFLG